MRIAATTVTFEDFAFRPNGSPIWAMLIIIMELRSISNQNISEQNGISLAEISLVDR